MQFILFEWQKYGIGRGTNFGRPNWLPDVICVVYFYINRASHCVPFMFVNECTFIFRFYNNKIDDDDDDDDDDNNINDNGNIVIIQ